MIRTTPLLLAALACRVEPDKTFFGTVSDSGDTDPTDTIDTETGDDTGTSPTTPELPVQTWTPGPALPDCAPVAGDPDIIALSGVVLLPTGAVAGEVVFDRATGTILCAGDSCDLTGATVICTEGVLSPALIDSHDHTQYNVLAPWQTSELYEDRYDWQSDPDYYEYREAYDNIADTYVCEIVK